MPIPSMCQTEKQELLVLLSYGNCTLLNLLLSSPHSSNLHCRRISSNRQWNFVCIDVGATVASIRQSDVFALIFPRTTIMDMTIGTALWFAAEGKGRLFDTEQEYTCQAKVLLNGLGADEQLAGYGRHRSAFKYGAWIRLHQELQKDVYRLWQRNLGTDHDQL